MGFNICAVVGAVIAVAGCLLASGLFITQEIAEVFVAKGGGELSCAIGNLGIQTAAYDPSCLTDAELEGSNLGSVNDDGSRSLLIEPFSSDTEEFKLLFPTQQEFMYEFNLALILLTACLEADPVLSPICLGFDLEVLFPEFDGDCEAFWDGQFSIQPGLFAGLKPVVDDNLFPALFGLPFIGALGAYFNNTEPLVGGIIVAFAGVFDAVLGPGGTFSTNATIAAGQLAGIQAGVLPNFPTAAQVVVGRTIDAVNVANCLGFTAQQCLGALFLSLDPIFGTGFSGTQITDNREAEFCEIFTGTLAVCNAGEYALVAAGAVQAINEVAPNDLLAQLAGGLLILARSVELQQTGTVGGVSVLSAPQLTGLQGFLAFVAPADENEFAVGVLSTLGFTNTTGFPQPVTYPTNGTAPYPPCQILESMQLLSPAGECSFQALMTSISDIAVAGGAPEQLLVLTGPLQALFAQCFAVQNGQALFGLTSFQEPDECYGFFAAFAVNTAFSNAFEDEIRAFTPGSNAVYEAAKEACTDDEADLVAITTAQNIVPVGIVFFALGAVAALAAAGLNNKVIALMSGLLLVLAGVLILAALATVYGAPIYESVGDPEDSELNEVIYVAGKTINIGVFSIVLAIASGICMVISAIMMHRSADEAEVKALGGGDKSTVSI